MTNRWLAILVAAGIFAAGATAGIAIDRLLLGGDQADHHRGRPRGPDELLERYRGRLDLDGAQTDAVRQVLDRRFREADAVMQRVDPEMEEIRRRANDEVRALLRPDQQKAFEEIVREQEERRADFRRRVGGK